MTGEEIYEVWAPSRATWSVWAKPVLFAQPEITRAHPAEPDEWQGTDTSWAPGPGDPTALVVDLAGRESVGMGLALAARGYRPVPLYNACPGPAAVVPMEAIVEMLGGAAPYLAGLSIDDDAPPAFLLDADRMRGTSSPPPGSFDNRWMVFPQDFPSATFLRAHRIGSVVLAQVEADQPREDLAHVLLRWQEAGLPLELLPVGSGGPPRPLHVRRPSRFRSLCYRALAVGGLCRSSAAGFGAVVPEPSSG